MGVVCEGGVCRLDNSEVSPRSDKPPSYYGTDKTDSAFSVPKDSPLALFAVDELGGAPSAQRGVLEDETGREVDLSFLKGKLVGLYFSAGWCPPCRAFSPVLADFARFHRENFVVIFVSSDHTQPDMEAYVAGKGFLRIPWANIGLRRQLQSYLGVSMLPTLAICDADSGAMITTWGRMAVSMNARNCISEWRGGCSGLSLLSMLGLGGLC